MEIFVQSNVAWLREISCNCFVVKRKFFLSWYVFTVKTGHDCAMNMWCVCTAEKKFASRQTNCKFMTCGVLFSVEQFAKQIHKIDSASKNALLCGAAKKEQCVSDYQNAISFLLSTLQTSPLILLICMSKSPHQRVWRQTARIPGWSTLKLKTVLVRVPWLQVI